MIPIRARTDSPITTFKVMPAMSPEHPLAQRGVLCPVCDRPLTGAPFTLVLVGFHPEDRREGKLWGNGATVPVHADCAGLSVDDDGELAALAQESGYTVPQLMAYVRRITEAIEAFDDRRINLAEFKSRVEKIPQPGAPTESE